MLNSLQKILFLYGHFNKVTIHMKKGINIKKVYILKNVFPLTYDAGKRLEIHWFDIRLKF